MKIDIVMSISQQQYFESVCLQYNYCKKVNTFDKVRRYHGHYRIRLEVMILNALIIWKHGTVMD